MCTLLYWLIFCFLSVFLPQSGFLLLSIWGHVVSSLPSRMSNCFLKCSMGSVEKKWVSLQVSQILFSPIFSAIYSFKPPWCWILLHFSSSTRRELSNIGMCPWLRSAAVQVPDNRLIPFSLHSGAADSTCQCQPSGELHLCKDEK